MNYVKYSADLINRLIENNDLEIFVDDWDKCEVIIDYITEWFNNKCHLETIEGKDVFIAYFDEKYYNKEFNFTHGVIQRVRGIFCEISDNEHINLYLLSDTRCDDSIKCPEPTNADKEFIKAILDNNCKDSFLFELEHSIKGFCLGELKTLLNIILDKKDNLIEIV